MKVSLQDILAASERLKGFIHPTETDTSRSTSKLVGAEVYFKYENLQRTGSFKIRGAFNKIASLSEEEKRRGVVASSAGNHAQGVALSAHLAGVKSTVVMPEAASLNKIAATRSYGAEVVLHGDFYEEAYAKAREIEKATGAVFVHPYEDPLVIAGQGTIGLEVLDAVPDLDSIIVAVGGGGLISGIAAAIKAKRPQCRVIGVQTEAAHGMVSLFKGENFQAPAGRVSTIADGIAVKTPSKQMHHDFIASLVDEMVTVNDDEIAAAIVFLLERTKNLVEGAGAAAVAALLNRKLDLGKKTCAILCGGNIDLNVIAKVVDRGLLSQGRLAEISVIVDDQPGSLSRLTQIFADQKANILDIRHDRVERGLALKQAKVDFMAEVSSHEHADRLRAALAASGAKIL
jgi:threonine dehydratase